MSKYKIENMELQFGKFKGLELKVVFKEFPEYVRYLYEEGNDEIRKCVYDFYNNFLKKNGDRLTEDLLLKYKIPDNIEYKETSKDIDFDKLLILKDMYITFGKYEKKNVFDLLTEDMEYLKWAIKKLGHRQFLSKIRRPVVGRRKIEYCEELEYSLNIIENNK